MGDGDEGGSESPTGPNKTGNSNNSGDDTGDYTEGQNKSVGKTEKDLLGAKPELINPPHLDRTTTAKAGMLRAERAAVQRRRRAGGAAPMGRRGGREGGAASTPIERRVRRRHHRHGMTGSRGS